jgi:hypothetical protein
VSAPYIITRDQLRDYVKVPAGNDVIDRLLDVALSGAHDWIHTTTGRTFDLAPAPTARTLTGAGHQVCTRDYRYRLLLDWDVGTTVGLVVETGSGTTWSVITAYDTGPEDAISQGWPVRELTRDTPWPYWAGERVRVTARWGWPAVPDAVVEACYIQAGRLYRRRDSPEGVLGGSDWGVVRVGRADPDATALLDPYVLAGIG